MQQSNSRTAFTLTEVLVVMMMLAILVSLVLYATSGVSRSDALMRSQNNLRDINTLMQQYTGSNDARILPSQFDRYDEESGDGATKIGGPASRMSYELTENGAEWIENNNPYQSLGQADLDLVHRGTWADLIWVEGNLGDTLAVADLQIDEWGGDSGDELYRSYKYSVPDRTFYEQNPRWDKNPLRSVVVNTWNWPRWDDNGDETDFSRSEAGTASSDGLQGLPIPRGSGAWEKDYAGFFAANNFFDSRSARDISGDEGDSTRDRYWAEGQIKAPSRSLYLVDSFAGETIGGTPGFLGTSDYADQQQQYYEDTSRSFEVAAQLDVSTGGDETEIEEGRCNQEVDFRYGNQCLMLFLDGHVEQQDRWSQIWDLEGQDDSIGRGIRILDLDKRQARPN